MKAFNTRKYRSTFLATLACGLTLTALAGSSLSARAQSSYTVNFYTGEQSIWNTGTDATLDQLADLTGSWDTGNFDKHKQTKIPILGRFGVGVYGSTSGTAGLLCRNYSDTGTLNISYPINMTVKTSNTGAVAPGTPVTVTISGTPDKHATISTHLDAINQRVTGVLACQFDFHEWIEAFSDKTTSHQSGGFDVKFPIFDTSFINTNHYTSDTTFNLSDSLMLEYSPSPIETSGAVRADGSLYATTGNRRPLLTIQGDITSFLVDLATGNAAALNNPDPVTGSVARALSSINYDKSAGGLKFGWHLADLTASVYFRYRQTFTFQPTAKYRLKLANGTVTSWATLGTPITFAMPAASANGGRANLTVTPEFMLDNSLNNRTTLEISPGLEFNPLQIYANVDIKHFKEGFDFQPLDTIDLLASILKFTPNDSTPQFLYRATVPIYDKSFAVNFSTMTGSSFVIPGLAQ